LTGLNVDVKGLPHYISVMGLFHKNILLRRSLVPDVYPKEPEARAAKQLDVFQMGVNWVRDGRVNLRTLITHELPLEEVAKGLWLCRKRPDETIKVVIHI
jgi:threonine dehydrogenase-like Zn-dependent dehydrogenase